MARMLDIVFSFFFDENENKVFQNEEDIPKYIVLDIHNGKDQFYGALEEMEEDVRIVFEEMLKGSQ